MVGSLVKMPFVEIALLTFESVYLGLSYDGLLTCYCRLGGGEGGSTQMEAEPRLNGTDHSDSLHAH